MKTFYEIIGVEPTASVDEIKRKFRQEIARYHPDKVQHLGKEFQELASERAAELTQAYRVLMDERQRAEYDRQLGEAPVVASAPAASPATPPAADRVAVQEPPPAQPQAAPPRFQKEQATTDDFVRRAALARFREAVEVELDGCQAMPAKGFDAGYLHRPKRSLFKKADAPVRVLGRFVTHVDSAALHDTWVQAVKVPVGEAPQAVVFLMGKGLAPARELAGAIAEERRKPSRAAGAVTLIPVDVRDWQALIPTDAPPLVRPLLERLRTRG